MVKVVQLSAGVQSTGGTSSDLQPRLQGAAGFALVLVEGIAVDIHRGRGLGVSEEPGYRGHVRAARDQKAGVGVAQGVDVQIFWQAVLLQDQLEPSGEPAGSYGQRLALAPEDIVVVRQLPLIVGGGLIHAFLPVLVQQCLHLVGEVHITIPCAGLGFFHDHFLSCELHHVPLDFLCIFYESNNYSQQQANKSTIILSPL